MENKRISTCHACKMISAGVKSRRALTHTCEKHLIEQREIAVYGKALTLDERIEVAEALVEYTPKCI